MTITPELKAAIDHAGDDPVRIEDPETNRSFVLIRSEQFDRIRDLLSQDPVERMAPFLDEAFVEGWDDPALDVYIDPRRP